MITVAECVDVDTFALLITGPPGAGKTEVPAALSDSLVADDVRHVMLEVEALTSA